MAAANPAHGNAYTSQRLARYGKEIVMSLHVCCHRAARPDTILPDIFQPHVLNYLHTHIYTPVQALEHT